MADTTITRIGPNGIAVPEKMHDNGDGTYSSQPYTSGGGGATTIADGADVTQGAVADAAVAAGAAGSISAKLRAISRDLVANIVLKAGTAIIGKVGIDQTTPGTTNGVVVNSGTLVASGSLGNDAGENHIGQVGGETMFVQSTVVMSVAGAYAAGDYIGTTTAPQSFTNANRIAAGRAIVKSLVISDKTTTAVTVGLELWLFSATFVAPTDNAAWAISDAEALTCLGVIPIVTGKWYATANNKVYSDDTLGLVVKPAARDLYYALVARGTTPSWTSGDLQITLGLLGD